MKADDLTTQTEAALAQRGIRPTAVRLLVAKALATAECALSLTDLEARLGTVDKSSIFRTLNLLLLHHLIHGISDGTGMTKYAWCRPDCHCGEPEAQSLHDYHTHFHCERCGRTFCLHGLPVPDVQLPQGFTLHAANFVLSGLCPPCAQRHSSGLTGPK